MAVWEGLIAAIPVVRELFQPKPKVVFSVACIPFHVPSGAVTKGFEDFCDFELRTALFRACKQEGGDDGSSALRSGALADQTEPWLRAMGPEIERRVASALPWFVTLVRIANVGRKRATEVQVSLGALSRTALFFVDGALVKPDQSAEGGRFVFRRLQPGSQIVAYVWDLISESAIRIDHADGQASHTPDSRPDWIREAPPNATR